MEESPSQVHWNLRRVVRGDPEATAWLYDQFSSKLFRRLRSRYQYPGGIDAEDLLQDAFVFYLQRDAKVIQDFLERVPESAQTATRLERHLWDLACGLASNRRRSLKRKKDEPLPDDQWLDDPSAQQDEDLIGKQELRLLDDCLKGSGPKVYLYYTLRYFDGHTPAEIAEITGWTMKSTYRQRQKLNEALRKCAQELDLEHHVPAE